MPKVITGDIQNLDISWENYSGESVEKFIKNQLSASCGYLYRSNTKEGDYYYLYGFHSIDDYNDWLNGDDITPLFRVQLPNIENDVFTSTLTTNSNTNKLVNLGDGIKINIRYTSTSTNPSTQAVSDTYNDGTLIINRSANGSAFVEVGRIIISPIEHNSTAFQTIDITQYLADGDNKIRLRVEDNINGSVSNNINFNSIVNTTLKVTNATDVTTPLYTTTLQYYIEGQIAKTLNINITQDGNTDSYALPIGTSSWIEAPYFAQIDKTYNTGTIEVESWLSVDDTVLESEHITNQFYYINGTSTEDIIILNNVETNVINYANTHFFDFVVYNASTDVNITIQNGNKIYLEYTFNNCAVNTLYSFYNVLQVEEELNNIPATVTVTTNSDNQTYVINIDNTEKMSPTSGADLIINPLVRNNSELNPARIINEANGNSVTATFNGFGFVNDGWVSDNDGIKVLRIPAGTSINISYDVFDNLTNGTTIELDYKVYNIFNDNDEMIKMYTLTGDNKTLGFVMNATEAAFYTAENQTKRDQDVMFQEEVRTHMAINIIPNLANSGLNYIRIFINGVMNREMLYTNSDIFKNGSVSINLGSNNCDLDIYSIRVYKKGLSASDVRQDYMSSIPNIEDKIAFKTANDILSANGTISYDKASVKYNTLIWTGEHPEYRTGNQEYAGTLQINIIGDSAHSGTITNLRIKGQGSSSRGYWKWNHQYDMDKLDGLTSVWTDGNGNTHTKGYKLTDDEPAASKLVAKLNWASSMQSHKIGSTALYTDIWKEVVGGNSITRTEGFENTRVSVHEKPFLYFIKDTANSTPVFAGLMTFGSGKYDKLTFGYDKKVFPDYLIIEGSDNGMPLTNRQIPWFEDEVTYNSDEEYYQYAGQGNWDYGMGNQNMLHYFIDANNFVYSHSIRIRPYTDSSELTDRTYQYWNTVNGNIVRYDYINKEWVNGGISKTNGEYDSFNVFTQTGITASGNANTDNAAIIAWRIRDFKNNISLYYNVNDVIYSMAFLKMIAASDNRCKNIYEYLDPVTHKICLAQDDMDTIMLTDNVGRKTKPYYVEEHDQNPNGGWYFNGEDSNFFTLMDAAFDSELRTMMKSILAEMSSSKYGGSAESCLQRYFFDVQEYFPAVAFNETARLLYEEAAVYQAQHIYDNGTPAISQSLGNQLEAEKQWWTRRLKYLQSWAGSDPFYVRSTTSPSLNFRSLTTVGGNNPNYQFTLTPWQWLYPKVGTGQVPGQDNTRVAASTSFTTMNLVTDGNTDTFIYGSDYYTSFGEFGDKSIGETFNLNGKRLLEFSADSREVVNYEFRPIAMTVNCPVLRSLVLYGCSTLSGSLNLSNCTKLEVIDLRGTSLSSVILPVTDTLTTVYLPDLASITVVGCPNITTFSVAGYNNLISLTTDNSSLAESIISNVNTINSVDLKGINITTTTNNVDKFINILTNENINCTITGAIYLDASLTNTQINAIEDKFGESVWNNSNSLFISYVYTNITSLSLTSPSGRYGSLFQNDSITIDVVTDGNNIKNYSWGLNNTIDLTTVRKKNQLVINTTTFNKLEKITITYTLTTTNNQTFTANIDITACHLDFTINNNLLRNSTIDMLVGNSEAYNYYTLYKGFTYNENLDYSGTIEPNYSAITTEKQIQMNDNGDSTYSFGVNGVYSDGVVEDVIYPVVIDSEYYVYVPFKVRYTTIPSIEINTISNIDCLNGNGSFHVSWNLPEGYGQYMQDFINAVYLSNIPSNKYNITNISNYGCDVTITGITTNYSSQLKIGDYPYDDGNYLTYCINRSNTFNVNYVKLAGKATIKYDITSVGTTQILSTDNQCDLTKIKKMMVENVEITPSKTYNFTTTGIKTIIIEAIDDYDFKYLLKDITTVKSITFENTSSIGNYACSDCTNLESVTLVGSISYIHNYTFRNCTKLDTINATDLSNCPTIVSTTFSGVKSYGTVNLPQNIDFSSWFSTGTYYLGYYLWNTEEVVLNNVKYRISIPTNTASTVGFTSSITSNITYKSSIQYNGQTYTINRILGIIAADVSHLSELNITFEDGITNDMLPITGSYYQDGIFKDVRTKIKSVTLSNRMTMNISHLTCYNCTNLTTFNYTNQSTSVIGEKFFYGCSSLTNLNRVLLAATTIDQLAFCNCTSLTSINLPTVQTIDVGAFNNCTSLTNITIGNNINNIKNSSFQNCPKVNTITINKSIAPTIMDNSFGTTNYTTGYSSGTTNVLYVPQNATGYDDTNWTDYLLNPSYGNFTLSKTL